MQLYQHLSQNKQQVYLLLLFIFTCVIGIVTICHHEMWRDESQAFLLVRDSKNLSQLWQNVRYEGHPILWHFILFIAYYLFPSLYTLQVVHMIFGLSVICLIVFYSPFTFLEKFLLCFSYFFSFEYLVISRNYSPGIFLLFLAIILFHKLKGRRQMLLTAFILGLAANSNIYALIISCCLFIYFLSALFPILKAATYKSRLFYSSVIVFSFLLAIAFLQLVSPPDRTPKIVISTNLNSKKIDKITGEISKALFYMPDPSKKEAYWGSYLFDGNWFGNKTLDNFFMRLPQLLTFATIFLLLISLGRSSSITLFFAASFIGLFLFMYIIFNKGLLRHTGAFFVLFVIALWLYRSSKVDSSKSAMYLHRLFITMLLLQLAGSAVAHIAEVKYSFSGAKDAASFLIKTGRNNEDIILHPDFEGMALLHYAGIKRVYYCTIHGKGSFIKFSDARKPCSYNDIYKIAVSKQIATMVFNGIKNDSLMNKIGYQLIYQPPTRSTVSDENFYMYGKK